MFHGPELINPDLAGTVIVRKLEKAGQNPAICQFRGWNRLGRRQLLCRGDRRGRWAGGLACIGGKIRPGRETQCGCAGDDEDDSHLMSP